MEDANLFNMVLLTMEKSLVTEKHIRLVLILAGALFYATVTFSFFSVPKYSTLSTKLPIILAKCTLVRKKRGISPPQNEGQA